MGLMIDVGGGAGQFGAGLGAGFAKGTENRLAQEREDQLRAEAQAEKQALADEMVSAVSQDFASRADSVRETIPAIGPESNPGTATMVGTLPMYLNPGPNPDLAGHDEWVGQHMGVLKSMKSPEAAKVYAESLGQEFDRTIRARATKRLNGTITAALNSGALTQEEASVFLEELGTTGDVASVYNSFSELRAQKVEAANRTRRGVKRIESAEVQAEHLKLSANSWDREKAAEIEDLVGRARVDGEWGDEDFDYEAWESDYQGIVNRYSPAQQARADAEKRETQLATAKLLGSLISDLKRDNPDADTSQYEEQMRGLIGDVGIPSQPPNPDIPLVVAPGQEANYDPSTGSMRDAAAQSAPKSTAQVPERITQGTIRDGVGRIVQKMRSADSYPTPTDALADAQALLQIAYQQWGVTKTNELPAKVQAHFKALEAAALEQWPELAPKATPATQKPTAALPVID